MVSKKHIRFFYERLCNKNSQLQKPLTTFQTIPRYQTIKRN
jgi:hypothetical protein